VADQTKYTRVRSKVWEDIIRVGWGGTETTVAPGRGQPGDAPYKIVARRCHWDRMFWDPHSEEDDFSDATYRGLVVWKDRDEAVRQYGEDAAKVFDETVTACNADTYSDKPAYETWVSNGTRRRVRIVQIYHIAEDGQYDFAEFTRGGILMSGPSPWQDVNGRRTHPYDWQSCYIDRDNNRYGVIRDLIDPQDEINKRRSKALHSVNVRQTFGSDQMLSSMTVKDMRRELARPDGHVPLAPNVQWGKNFGIIPTNDISTGNMELLQQVSAVFETMGPNAALLGKQTGAPSGRAVLASQQGGQIQIGPVTDALHQLDLDVFTRWWIYVQQFWTEETWIRVEDDQNALRWVALNQHVGIDPLGNPIRKNSVTELDVDIEIDEAPAGGTIADETFQTLVTLKQMDQKGEIPFSQVIAAAPNLRNKTELVQAVQQREQAPPNPLQVAGATAEVQDKQAGANLKNAQAARTQAEVGKTKADIEHTTALARKAIIETHGSAMDSVKTGFDIATLLQQPQQPVQQDQGQPPPAGQ
jgi:hypothetical protein